MSTLKPLGLFDAVGVEIEYMIVDRDTLDVAPRAEAVLRDEQGEIQNEVEHGPIAWSNELVSHVVELKTAGPVPSLDGLASLFHANVTEINRRLESVNSQLMPTAMHPWMNPFRETLLWPHENSEIYDAFNRIFDCRGHGWSNLQSIHLNLPFADDEEFARLHAAVRILLPILPAIAASSPVADRQVKPQRDYRLEVYRQNCQRIPSVTGRVIPEPVFSIAEYQERILQPMYRDIAPHDPEGILQEEWLNARGAIARFERNTIEIRVLDAQECPRADLAIAAIVVATLRALCEERWCSLAQQQSWEVEPLEHIFLGCVAQAEDAVINNQEYTRLFGYRGDEDITAGELWKHLNAALSGELADEHRPTLEAMLTRGSLATKLAAQQDMEEMCRSLMDCLQENRLFGIG